MSSKHTTLDRLTAGVTGELADRESLRPALAEVAGRATRSRMTQYALVEVAAPCREPIDLLDRAPVTPVVFWQGRNSDRAYAGVGAQAAIRLSGPDAMRQAIDRATSLLDRCVTVAAGSTTFSPRLFAGFAFEHAAQHDPIWAGYDDAFMVLPALTLVAGADGAHAYLTIEVPPDANVEALLETLDSRAARLSLATPERDAGRLPAVVLSDVNDRGEWLRAVERALGQMREGQLEKVVLARRITLTADATIPPGPLMRRLRDTATGCFHFAFSMKGGQVFAGASPERLFRLQEGEIETDCLAGTTERGSDTATDTALADALLASAKDRLEHYYVLEDSLHRLGDLCTELNADTKPRIIKLSTLQHLATTVRGRLKDGVGVGDLLEQLHPTPAVGGTPRGAALAAIRTLEPQPRGWYAGPVGWIERDRAEFAVAIRSALLNGAHAHVFAGAGIVPGSVPEKEWQETQHKAEAFLKAVWG